jgi:predicted  nucleic acid-binding Zn-ribbon protein
VRAAPEDQLRLLDLQAVDLSVDQLTHRRRTLPEHREIAAIEAELPERSDAVTRAQLVVDDLERRIARVEGDAELARQRAARDRSRMDSGVVSAPKELERLQHEVATLARRQSELEDRELELMEELEEATRQLADATERLADAEGRLAAVAARRDVAYAEIDAAEAERRAERGPIAADVPDDLLALYEKLRGPGGGIGAAALRARRCGGCRIELSGTDLAAAKAADPDEVLRCEECRRILVRTAESGL